MKNIFKELRHTSFSQDSKPLFAGFVILALVFAAGCTSNGRSNDKADANKYIDSLAQSKTAAQEEQKPMSEHQQGMGMGKSGQGMGHEMMMQKDHLMMKGGKMIMVKNGKDAIMDKDMTLSNGTKVRKDGTVEMKNGKNLHLQEGEMMDMDGEMGRM